MCHALHAEAVLLAAEGDAQELFGHVRAPQTASGEGIHEGAPQVQAPALGSAEHHEQVVGDVHATQQERRLIEGPAEGVDHVVAPEQHGLEVEVDGLAGARILGRVVVLGCLAVRCGTEQVGHGPVRPAPRGVIVHKERLAALGTDRGIEL